MQQSRIVKYGLWIIFVQACVAMAGSLYFGFFWDPHYNFIMGEWFNRLNAFPPCDLCRYARILMYPIVWFSGIALIKRYYHIVDFLIPVSALGVCLEVFHYLLQKSTISTDFFCTGANPCTAMQVNYFGFITIPFLCLIAFAVILVTSMCIRRSLSQNK